MVRGLFIYFAFVLQMTVLLSPDVGFAATQERQAGFVQLATGRSLYVDYLKPAPGKPVVVLLNGLTYDTTTWDKFVAELKGDGLGILRYDPVGMGQTLQKYGRPDAPIAYRDQISDLYSLLDALEIHDPVHINGLSYGGALALEFAHEHPDRVENIILMAPFVAPLDSQDKLIKFQIQQIRLLFPWNAASYDELYDYFLKLNINITYPLAEPSVLDSPYKLEATYRMVQGIRKFLAADISKFEPNVGVHMMVGRKDQYIEAAVHETFWKLLQEDARKSFLYLENTEHKIPEASPRFSALWVRNIIEKNPAIGRGQTYSGDPRTLVVKSGDKTFRLADPHAPRTEPASKLMASGRLGCGTFR